MDLLLNVYCVQSIIDESLIVDLSEDFTTLWNKIYMLFHKELTFFKMIGSSLVT